jgi:PAS domain-containing protein
VFTFNRNERSPPTEIRILQANPAYCREAGVNEAEALGKLYWQVFPLDSGPIPERIPGLKTVRASANEADLRVGIKHFLVLNPILFRYIPFEALDRMVDSVDRRVFGD